jgi:LmbE family N-acetylglucosaminyl deacetylase
MLSHLDVDALFIPYRREYHADHRAAWQIGQACRREGMRVYEYPIWYGPWLWRRLGWQARLAAALHLVDLLSAVKVSIAEVSDVKQQALGAYRSQLSGFERLGPWGAGYLANFSGRYEVFFVTR